MQIGNLDEGKAEWINEAQLIVPIADGEKSRRASSKTGMALSGVEGADQALLTNGAGHAFVIGLDKSMFDGGYGAKSDLLLMPNSDLKLVAEGMPPGGKSEVVWNGFEKPKDILTVMQESTKAWSELTKSDLEDVDGKLGGEFLVDADLAKKDRGDDQHYIVGYYPVVETCDAVLVPASLMTLQQKTPESVGPQKTIVIENDVINNTHNISQLFGNESIEDSQSFKWMKPEESSGSVEPSTHTFLSGKMTQEGRLSEMNDAQDGSVMSIRNDKFAKTVIPFLHEARHEKSDDVELVTKDEKSKAEFAEAEKDSISEQSLPLKKKAKMKKSPIGGSSNSGGGDRNGQKNQLQSREGIHNSREDQNAATSSVCRDASDSDSDEPLARKRSAETDSCILKRKKKKKKKKKRGEHGGEMRGSEERFASIADLLERLKSEKYINDAIMKILLAGLEEMKVDVLGEMYEKRDSGVCKYSRQLKAFALVTHFKQPSAFERIGQIFGNGWPSLNTIKDWKRRLNDHRRCRASSVEDEKGECCEYRNVVY